MSTAIAIDSRQFRTALGAFTTGVTIVTTVDAEGRDVGLTANSFNSLSLDPPLVLWSLANTSLSMPAFQSAPYFAVHVLAADQQPLSDLFARRGADKFAGLIPERGPGGIPLLHDCSARFQCRTAFRHAGGDHEIFIGEVIAFDHGEKPPLAFQGGGYGRVVKKAPVAFDAAQSSFNKNFLGYLLGSVYHQLGAKIRRVLAAQGFDEDAWLLMTILGAEDDRLCDELDTLLQVAGHCLDDALIERLAGRGLLVRENTVHGVARLRLTEAGRTTALEFFTIAKAAEEDMLNGFDYDESYLLKQLLRRAAQRADAELPPLWRKKHDAAP